MEKCCLQNGSHIVEASVFCAVYYCHLLCCIVNVFIYGIIYACTKYFCNKMYIDETMNLVLVFTNIFFTYCILTFPYE